MSYDFENSGSLQHLKASSTLLSAYGYSIAFWFKIESYTADQMPFSLRCSASSSCALFAVNSSNQLSVFRRSSSDNTGWVSVTTSLSLATWYLGVYVESAKNARAIYMNTAASKVTNATDLIVSTWGSDDLLDRIGVGCRTIEDTNAFDGKVGHVAVWNIALADADITSLYNGGSYTSPTNVQGANLVHYWPMTADPNDTKASPINLTVTGATLDTGDNPFTPGASTKPAYYYAQQ